MAPAINGVLIPLRNKTLQEALPFLEIESSIAISSFLVVSGVFIFSKIFFANSFLFFNPTCKFTPKKAGAQKKELIFCF